MCYEPSKASRIIIASMVLHNYCVLNNIELLPEDANFRDNTILPELILERHDINCPENVPRGGIANT